MNKLKNYLEAINASIKSLWFILLIILLTIISINFTIVLIIITSPFIIALRINQKYY